MHACGHDCHIAMMLGTLQILRHMTDDIHGEIRVVFQPSEENGSGARMMCEAGVCEGVDGAFAMHIWSEVDAGTISCEPGPRMANTDWFRVDVHGTSCHGAMPQRCLLYTSLVGHAERTGLSGLGVDSEVGEVLGLLVGCLSYTSDRRPRP